MWHGEHTIRIICNHCRSNDCKPRDPYLKCIHHFATDLVDTYLEVVYKDIYTAPYTNSHYDEEGRGMLRSNTEKVK